MTRMVAPWKCTFVLAFAAYMALGVQRLPGGDSGELLAEACLGGVAHPPGYPLLLLVLRLTKQLGTIFAPGVPFVVLANGLNAAFAAAAAACVSHSVWLVADRQSPIAAVFAGLLFASSELTIEYAVGLEVFALNNLLVGALHISFVRHFVEPPSVANLVAGAFLCGLGLTNQHTISTFLLGLAPYTSTLLAAQVPRPGSWGDTSTIGGLLHHILRREYGTFKLSPQTASTETVGERMSFYLADAIQEIGPLGVWLAALGLLALLTVGLHRVAPHTKARPPTSISRWLGLAQLTCWAFYVGVFNSLANLPLASPLPREVTRRFFLQPHLLLAVWSGVGVAALELLAGRGRVAGEVSVVGRSLSLTVAVAVLARRNLWAALDPALESPDLIRAFGEHLLDGLPANALLLSYTDIQWNSVRYLQVCESQRSDVQHLNLQVMAFPWFRRQHALYPGISFPALRPDVSSDRLSSGYAAYLSKFIQANSPRDAPMFLDLHALDDATIRDNQLVFHGLQVLPRGLVWEVHYDPPAATQRWRQFSTAHSPSAVLARFEELVQEAAAPSISVLKPGRWEFAALSIAHDAVYQRNLARLGYWLAHGQLTTLEELHAHVLAFNAMQRELLTVLRRANALGSNESAALSYPLFAVEKNALVSQQRFQLYLDALSDVVVSVDAHGHESIDHTATTMELRQLIAQRHAFRDAAIRHTQAFLPTLRAENDSDADAIQEVLTRLLHPQSMQRRAPKQQQQKKKRKRSRKKMAA
ncbi:hypothetical protein P43SY_009048 [Pythium insidiosum]|uniref:DUF2723 domain-containing protein n=1 Tax=Pythium insidiosum TaxID=114742 RepID=A0AAD5Q9V6_PYTIN|nr:hypothetical protein P43SY_009048 [Pythium insidiosum]